MKNVLLAINFNFPHYSSIPLLKRFYQDIFGNIVFCGAKKHPDVTVIDERQGYQGYECIAMTIRMFPEYIGYLYINDDVVLNWWNIIKLDPSKIWTGTEVQFRNGHVFGERILPSWRWWGKENTAKTCEVAFKEISTLAHSEEGERLNLPTYLRRYYANTDNRRLCVNAWSDVFYIPKSFSEVYARLSGIYAKHKVFLEVAVPGILGFFLNSTNNYNLNGTYFYDEYYQSPKYRSGEAFYETYSLDITFSHPFKLEGAMRVVNSIFFKNIIMSHGESIRHYCTHQ